MADSRTEGRRQGLLEKQREKMMADFEKQRQQIAKDSDVKIGDSKFVSQTDGLESSLKRSTVGLVQLEDFQRIRAELEHQREKDSVQVTDKAAGNEEKKKRQKKKRAKATLSFELEEEGADGDGASEKELQAKKPKLKKNPDVDTSFLPDRERDEEERKIREELRTEWLRNQEELKSETISITYSYWDGSGHRKAVECKKGDNIAQFLEKCRQQFHQLRSISVDNLLYIKEDLIIPHHYTFYDFIINKARGKSGPLFSFDVHEDVRLTNDATLEKDESHAGKVVERSWYERNKHIFPASRWEVFDPEKNYGTYTIKDSKADAVALRAATRKMGGH